MKKTVKGLVAVAMISTMAGSALFAAPRTKAPRRPALEQEVTSEFQTIIGKVRETKWGFVVIETDEGNRYVLNATDDPELISMNDIKVKAGNRMILTGKLNKESKIFTVTQFGFNETLDYADAK